MVTSNDTMRVKYAKECHRQGRKNGAEEQRTSGMPHSQNVAREHAKYEDLALFIF